MLDDWSGACQNDSMRLYRTKRDKLHVSVKDKYNFLGFISSGTYGRVYKVQSKESTPDSNVFYAVKKFKPDKEGEASYTGLSQSAIREIALNRDIDHENITALHEVVLEDKSIYMVFDYAEHDFLQIIHHFAQGLKVPLPTSLLKSLTYQMINGVLYLHSCHIMHRDLKPANILITSQGVVKIGDLGLARLVYEPLQPLTNGDKVVVTIWYRAPELLLGAKHYSKAVDMWAVGCVIAELAGLKPIFRGEEAKMDKKNIPFQKDQLLKIFEVRGTPDLAEWPSVRFMPEYNNMKRLDKYKDRLEEWCRTRIGSKEGYNLMRQLFCYDPERRISPREALDHKWFQEDPLPTRNAFYGLRNNQLPPLRKIAHDEASAAMQTATAARAPAAPAPASTTHPVTGNSNFASVGFGPGPAAPPPMPSSSYPTGAAYPGGPGMSRVNVGCSGNGNGGSESVAGNTRKKARMG